MNWWSPASHADRRPRLLLRNRIVAAVRTWFAERDFVEADPAALQVSPGNEAHLHAFATEAINGGGARRPLYLHTSPEFALKTLLAAGEERLFGLPHVFRNRERGALHHPEFTMLEWYRARESYGAVIHDTVALVRLASAVAERRTFAFRGRTCDALAEPVRITVQDAILRFTGIDLLATVSAEGETDRSALAAACRTAGIRTAPDDTWSDMFSRLIVEIEPRLGLGRSDRPRPVSDRGGGPRAPRRPTTPGSRSASSSTCAASRSRTASGS